MIPIKVQCACGQRYAFDVEPVNGRMPAPVACPVCGADGTADANEIIAQTLGGQPAVKPAAGVRIHAPAPVARSVPPPVPPIRRMVPKETRGKDGWNAQETSLNKLGTYIVLTPAILGALFSWGIFGIEVPPTMLWIVVAVCGIVGGAINVHGRGPMLAGAIVGLLMGLGGFGAVFWWVHGRERVQKFEVAIAFLLGAAPGFGCQYFIQYLLRKKAESQAG